MDEIELTGKERSLPTTQLVYVLAASHSGSTLTALLLNGHPDLCTVGELKANALGDVSRYCCSCARPILSCPFWAGVTDDLRGEGLDFSLERPGTDFAAVDSPVLRRLLRPLHRGPLLEALRDAALSLSPTWRRHLRRTQEMNAALMRVVLARVGKRAIVDSSKVGGRLRYLLRNPALDVKVIRQVRDGRAVALTYLDPATYADSARPERRGGGAGGMRASVQPDMAAAAREWRRSQDEAEAVLRGLGRGRWIEVRYEDLCRDKDTQLRRVFDFLGVPDARITLRAAEHHIIGNGMRLDDTREVRLDERWRDALDAGQLAVFDRVAGETNRRLGYR